MWRFLSKVKSQQTWLYYLLIFGLPMLLLGILSFYLFFQSPEGSLDEFIPNEAIVYMESENTLSFFQNLEQQAFWQNLKQSPFFQKVAERMEYLSLLLRQEGALEHFFRGKRLSATLHVSSREAFDLLYYIPLSSNQDKYFYNQVMLKFKGNRAFMIQKRSFSNIDIYEIRHKEGKTLFSFILHRGYLVGSYTPFLVEEVIRKLRKGEVGTEKAREAQAFFATRREIRKSEFRLLLHPPQMQGFLNIFFQKKVDFQLLKILPQDFYFYIEDWEPQILFQGGALPLEEPSGHPGNRLFSQQAPVKSLLQDWVPPETAIFHQISLSKPLDFFSNLSGMTPVARNSPGPDMDLLSRKGFSKEQFLAGVDKELGLCVLESRRGKEPHRLFFARMKDQMGSLRQMERISRGGSTGSRDYLGYKIRHIDLVNFPERVLGEMLSGFRQTYYTNDRQTLVLANDLEVLESWIEKKRQKQLGYFSPRQKAFFKELGPYASYRLILDMSRLWSILLENLREEWQPALEEFGPEIKSLGLIALEAFPGTERLSTRVHLKGLSDIKKREWSNRRWNIFMDLSISESIYSRPYMLKNQKDLSREILIQDFKNQLYLFRESGAKLWQKKAGAPLKSPIRQIDLYQDKQMQYLYLTPDRISLLDQQGRNVKRFPFYRQDTTTYLKSLHAFKASDPESWYFISSDDKGQLFMYDQNRQRMPGWRPKKLSRPLGYPVQSLLINGQAYLFAIQNNGLIHAFQLDGRKVAGFPYNAGGPVSNPICFEPGLEAASTFGQVITDEGKLIRFNLLGQIQDEMQVIRPSPRGRYEVCWDQEKKDWRLALVDAGNVKIMNQNGEVLFSKKFSSNSTKIEVQYFSFPNALKIIVMTDKIASRSYLYDLNGKTLAPEVASNKAVDMYFDGRTQLLYLYRVYGKRLSGMTLKIR